MRRVDQTILGPGDGYPRSGAIPGNCLQACVASLLDLELAAVPNFALFREWGDAVKKWSRPLGWTAYILSADAPTGWVLRDGSRLTVTDLPHSLILVGQTGHSSRHAVIGRTDWSTIWDPHPSRGGLTAVDTYVWFVATESGPMKWGR